MNKYPLTRKQKRYYDFIVAFWGTQGIFPSLTEIATFFKVKSHTTVWYAINHLEEKGYLRKLGSNKKRAYKLL